MRVLVTGGAGFVGSVAVRSLLERGNDVVVIDNLAAGHAEAISNDVAFHRIDLRHAESVESVLSEARPDAVLHFAALTVVPDSMRKPGEYFSVNTSGSINLLQSMVRNDVERIVFSSTAAVYGRPTNGLVKESDELLPISPYGSSKLMVEHILDAFGDAHGIKSASLRYFNVAGATETRGEHHEPETHLIPSAILAALGRRDPLTVFGNDYPTPDGTAVRDYVHVVDLVEAHWAAMERLDQSLGAMNLGGGTGASVKQVLDAVARVSGQEPPHSYGPRRDGDPPMLVADISRAKSTLDWEPRYSDLDTIVESSWNWFHTHPTGYAERTLQL